MRPTVDLSGAPPGAGLIGTLGGEGGLGHVVAPRVLADTGTGADPAPGTAGDGTTAGTTEPPVKSYMIVGGRDLSGLPEIVAWVAIVTLVLWSALRSAR